MPSCHPAVPVWLAIAASAPPAHNRAATANGLPSTVGPQQPQHRAAGSALPSTQAPVAHNRVATANGLPSTMAPQHRAAGPALPSTQAPSVHINREGPMATTQAPLHH
jgi:hypothetical protein